MRLTIISDTHNEHHKLGKLQGDVLIHCGEMFTLANRANYVIEEMDEWFGEQKFELILCTGGNHDVALQDRLLKTSKPFKNAIYLQDESYEYRGTKFYGSPWVPDLYRHAFYQDEQQLAMKWAMIPSDTDVLITHTPPADILDRSSRGLDLGCGKLAGELERVCPKLHCFGHVHASSGQLMREGTHYVNASSVDSQFKLARPPYEIVI